MKNKKTKKQIIIGGAVLIFTFFLLFFLYSKSKVYQDEFQNITAITSANTCIQNPNFFEKENIKGPVAIDLTQSGFTGIRIKYGKGAKKVFKKENWGKFGHFSSYALDKFGNIYLSPMPYISIENNTLKNQSNIYKIDSKSGELEVFMTISGVEATSKNPYGVVSLAYDCQTHSIVVSSISHSSFQEEKGKIFLIDLGSKKVTDIYSGADVLSLVFANIQTKDGRAEKKVFLGSARNSNIYHIDINNGRFISKKKLLFNPYTVSQIPKNSNKIYRMRFLNQKTLEIKTTTFEYSLEAESDIKRNIFRMEYFIDTEDKNRWRIKIN